MYRFFLASTLLVAALLVTIASASAQATNKQPVRPQRVFAHKNVEEGWSVAVAGKKPLLVMFTSDNCLYCKKMIKETYRHPAIEKMLVGNTESVLAHAEDYEALVKKLGIRGYPSSILIAPDGKVLDFMEGYIEPRAFAKRVYPFLHQQTAQVASKEPARPKNTSGR